MGLHTPFHRDEPHPDVVDHLVVTLMVGMQELYTFPDSILLPPAGQENETTWSVCGRVVRVPGKAAYPVQPGRPPPA